MPTPAAAATPLTALELGAWHGFLRVHAAVVRELEAELLAAHDLPLSSYEVLLVLEGSPHGRLRMSELADSVLLSRSGITRLVDRLAAEGLIERVTCPSDARGLYATLTERGRVRLLEARGTHLAGVRRWFVRRLSDDELRSLAAAWERLELEPGS